MNGTLNAVQIIARKRDRYALSPEEIAFFVRGFTDRSIPDYQMSALAMAIYLNGMQPSETTCLTREMLHSGQVLQWPAGVGPYVDKHSTGGIGDKVSIILAPLLACCDLRVPMISGRGLGPTGGTLDKLEAIPGLRTNLTTAEMRRVLDNVGCVINGATDELAPADRQLYALRDVTATVPSVPLITASIMSKKLAEGLDALVLDVKCGSGAFMKTLPQARALAESLVHSGREMDLKVSALITDMNQPLGRLVGNSVEVDEAEAVLQGAGPDDLLHVTLALAGELLRLTGKSPSRAAGEKQLAQVVRSGAGWEKLRDMIEAQGGDLEAPRDVAPRTTVRATQSGWVSHIDGELLGMILIDQGGGRRVKSDRIDHGVGLEMRVRIGDRVESEQPLADLFARAPHADPLDAAIRQAIRVEPQPTEAPELILDELT